MNRHRLLTAALLISVAVNLTFAGAIAWRILARPDFRPLSIPPNVGWIVRDLDAERRRELQPLLEQGSGEIRGVRREIVQSLRQVSELMTAAEFDGAALDQAFAELRAVSDRYQALSHRQAIAVLSELSEQERQVVRQFIQRRGPRERGSELRSRR